MKPFADLGHAIKAATAPCGIAYVQGQGWLPYDLKQGCPPNDKPDLLFLLPGFLPFPLNDDGAQSLRSLIEARA